LVATVQILAEGNLQLFVQAQICPSANSRLSQRARSQPVERELLPLLEEQASWQDTGQRFPLPPPERCLEGQGIAPVKNALRLIEISFSI
jgi:hypothetical protein